ncbi:hypothetical protein [Hyphomicrobium sp.]|uniref:hypothetical protein n=1 Tax=Hyphomicrobium sp. TaxID=82 RepID=UPI0025C310D1|nr:hypothetical protein [Hyphomicrobium sp.]MCC7251836.1 hypothetical protein [Hyphomicrobium sp.]
MSDRTLPRGQVRPVDPAWQLSPGEIAAMLARPYFTRFIVERRPRRKSKPARPRKPN